MAEQAYPKRTIKVFSSLLIVTAVIFYWVWGAAYDSWNIFAAENMGVYSIFIVLLGFGILGLLVAKYQH